MSGLSTIRYFFVTLIVLNGLMPVTSNADLILGNFPGNDAGFTTRFDSTGAYSIGFTVGSTPITLSSVDFRMNAFSAPGNATLELRNDIGGNPASVNYTFNSQSVAVGPTFQQYSFTPLVSSLLSANTTYWLTLGTDMNAPNGLVLATNDPSLTPTGLLATFVGLRSGTPSNQSFDVTGLVPNPSFQINGSAAVPEPTSWGALAMAATGVFCRKRWRLKQCSAAANMNR